MKRGRPGRPLRRFNDRRSVRRALGGDLRARDVGQLRRDALGRAQPCGLRQRRADVAHLARRRRQPVGVRAALEEAAGVLDRAEPARVLRPLVAVDVERHVPGIGIAEIGIAERHVVLDEARGLLEVVHPRTPVERVLAPQRREGDVIAVLHPGAVAAVAGGAARLVDGLASGVIGFLLGHRQVDIAARFDDRVRGDAGRQPLHVAFERNHHLAVRRGRGAVHRIGEAARQPFVERVHMQVLRTILREVDGGRPDRRGIGLGAGVQVAVGAGEVVADIGAAQLLGVDEDVAAEADHLALGPLGDLVGRGRGVGVDLRVVDSLLLLLIGGLRGGPVDGVGERRSLHLRHVPGEVRRGVAGDMARGRVERGDEGRERRTVLGRELARDRGHQRHGAVIRGLRVLGQLLEPGHHIGGLLPGDAREGGALALAVLAVAARAGGHAGIPGAIAEDRLAAGDIGRGVGLGQRPVLLFGRKRGEMRGKRVDLRLAQLGGDARHRVAAPGAGGKAAQRAGKEARVHARDHRRADVGTAEPGLAVAGGAGRNGVGALGDQGGDVVSGLGCARGEQQRQAGKRLATGVHGWTSLSCP
ncbi:hypothetical protein SDC9_38094 [bioreactor metagenome]|uniref:Uncharacterized protein n=1 Tax=bioreactor metagenome TaxID=1076179 RepID=A0A644VL60_9ZZZZ